MLLHLPLPSSYSFLSNVALNTTLSHPGLVPVQEVSVVEGLLGVYLSVIYLSTTRNLLRHHEVDGEDSCTACRETRVFFLRDCQYRCLCTCSLVRIHSWRWCSFSCFGFSLICTANVLWRVTCVQKVHIIIICLFFFFFFGLCSFSKFSSLFRYLRHTWRRGNARAPWRNATNRRRAPSQWSGTWSSFSKAGKLNETWTGVFCAWIVCSFVINQQWREDSYFLLLLLLLCWLV